MTLLIGFLTFLLVMNCLFLILLILIQLPKKEAGAGIAFGGAATDALFGAGSGNALTRLTKYTASFFVCLSILLSVLNMHAARDPSRRLERELARQAGAASLVPPAPATPNVQVQNITPPAGTNLTLQNVPAATTNLLSAPAAIQTNPVAPVQILEVPAAAPATPPK